MRCAASASAMAMVPVVSMFEAMIGTPLKKPKSRSRSTVARLSRVDRLGLIRTSS